MANSVPLVRPTESVIQSGLLGLFRGATGLVLEVPRTRTQGSPLETIGRYDRRTSETDEMVTSAYVQCVSTRNLSRVAVDPGAL